MTGNDLEKLKEKASLVNRKRIIKAAESFTLERCEGNFINIVLKLRSENCGKFIKFTNKLDNTTMNELREELEPSTVEALENIDRFTFETQMIQNNFTVSKERAERMFNVLTHLDSILEGLPDTNIRYNVALYLLVIMLDLGIKPTDTDWRNITANLNIVDTVKQRLQDINGMNRSELEELEEGIAERWEEEYE